MNYTFQRIILYPIPNRKIPWQWYVMSGDEILAGGKAKTRDRAERAAKKAICTG